MNGSITTKESDDKTRPDEYEKQDKEGAAQKEERDTTLAPAVMMRRDRAVLRSAEFTEHEDKAINLAHSIIAFQKRVREAENKRFFFEEKLCNVRAELFRFQKEEKEALQYGS
eukprot:CAMPEP_0194290468 /NCGR_PEP_ID=MMETSP0169-20130528/41298_1 /TAXON_ID=218684 /ORGANISM="Corethron pennatum, Strain L29A3" /LENGTH=112 /DNA_ID=CAMNT_0039038053 /DNA_START=52 /DNA_END=386 /DNA_ORIENTATION=+